MFSWCPPCFMELLGRQKVEILAQIGSFVSWYPPYHNSALKAFFCSSLSSASTLSRASSICLHRFNISSIKRPMLWALYCISTSPLRITWLIWFCCFTIFFHKDRLGMHLEMDMPMSSNIMAALVTICPIRILMI